MVRFARNRVSGFPLHHGRPYPQWAVQQSQVESAHAISYTDEHFVGVVPRMDTPLCLMVRVALRTAESGADGSNYSEVEVRAYTGASYEVVANLDTQSNPAALSQLTTEPGAYLSPGALITAYWTRTGSGSVDYSGDHAMVSLDILGVRQP